MIAPQVLNKDAYGINIFADGTSPTDRTTWTNVRYQTHSIQERAWNDKWAWVRQLWRPCPRAPEDFPKAPAMANQPRSARCPD